MHSKSSTFGKTLNKLLTSAPFLFHLVLQTMGPSTATVLAQVSITLRVRTAYDRVLRRGRDDQHFDEPGPSQRPSRYFPFVMDANWRGQDPGRIDATLRHFRGDRAALYNWDQGHQ